MRSRLPVLLIAAVSLLAVPAAAQAKLTVGIAENNPQLFGDPLFAQLKAKHARVVVSWNVATAAQRRDQPRHRVHAPAPAPPASRRW